MHVGCCAHAVPGYQEHPARCHMHVGCSCDRAGTPKFERIAPFHVRYNARFPVRVFHDHPVIAPTLGSHPVGAMRSVPSGVDASASNPQVRQTAVH